MEARYPKRVRLAEDRWGTLRPVGASDAVRLGQFLATLPDGAPSGFPSFAQDPRGASRPGAEIDSHRDFCLLALTDDDRVVGSATLHMGQGLWRRHLGEVRIVLAPVLEKELLAGLLIREIVAHAGRCGLQMVTGQILDTDLELRSAFQRQGFGLEAKLAGYALDPADKAHDVLVLTSHLDEQWHQMQDLVLDTEVSRGAGD